MPVPNCPKKEKSMSRRAKREAKVKSKIISKLVIVAIFFGLVFWVLRITPNYVNTDIADKTNLVINNNNVTSSLKKDVVIENGIIYISQDDIENFFDPYVYYDEKYNQIVTTSNKQIASIVIGENSMTRNGSRVNISGTVIERNDTLYLPFSSLKDVYNVEINYIESTDTITVDSKDRKYVLADSKSDNSVKAYPTSFSRKVDTINANETVTVVQNENNENQVVDGWVEIRTDTGKLGYIKEDELVNSLTVREAMESEKQIDGTVSMAWDYYYELSSAPDRTGTSIKGVNVVSPTFFTLVDEGRGQVSDNVGDSGRAYIEWAHSNGYKIWPSISNGSYIETTSEIMNDYNLRQELIQNIVSLVMTYDLDGINIDFEYMHDEDKDLFSRFIIELKPRLSEIGAVLSVDVTAPDGSDEWSLCYDRHVIGDIADYIVFMAYDQYGESSQEAGTTAGYNWVKANIEKFLGQEGVEANKIILGMPFYTRVWQERNGELVDNPAVDMKNIDAIVPEDATRTWDDNLKQYYVEYERDGVTNRIWIEDEQSIEAKLSLIQEYGLAGAAYWEKDREPDSIWNLISEKLGI